MIVRVNDGVFSFSLSPSSFPLSFRDTGKILDIIDIKYI